MSLWVAGAEKTPGSVRDVKLLVRGSGGVYAWTSAGAGPSTGSPDALSQSSRVSPTLISELLRRLPARRLRAELALKWRALPGNVRGGLWILLATFFLSIMVALIKIAGQHMHVTQILFFRQLTMLLLAMPVLLNNYPQALITRRPGLQGIRLIAAFFGMLFGFSAIIYLPLAEATTLSFAKTFFVGILAIVLLGEVVGFRRWSAIIFGFLGVVIIAWPAEGASFNIYSVMAIGSAMAVAVVMITLRQLAQVDRPVTILAYQAIGVGLMMLPPAIYFWTTPTLFEIALIILIGILTSIGQLCNIQGFKAGEASAIAPLDYARLVYAIIFGYLIFNEWPEPRVFVGAGMIVAAAIYTLHRERIRARETKAPGKTRVAPTKEDPS